MEVSPKRSICTVLLALLCTVCWAQTRLPYQQLLLLIAGPSGDRISPTEQSVVSFLNNLRGEYGLSTVQMGTMHFDRPRESRILKDSLGLSPQNGVSIALVQLSDQGVPIRALYKRENVTPQSLQRDHKQLLARWSEVSGETLPAALQTMAENPPIQTPPPANPPQHTPPASGAPERKLDVVYTFEGIRKIVFDLQTRSDTVWNGFKNAPMREDRMDVPLRQATLGLVEAAVNLRRAHEEGVIYPLEQLEAVRNVGREWKLAEPQFYLPVEQRGQVEPILRLLDELETIEYQGRRSSRVRPESPLTKKLVLLTVRRSGPRPVIPSRISNEVRSG